MSTYIIPLDNKDTFFKKRVELLDTVFILGFNYSETTDSWTIDIYDENGSAIILGSKLIVNLDLLGYLSYENIPEGNLIMVNTANQNEDPNYENFGTDCVLVYMDGE